MIRIVAETPIEVLRGVKTGDLITDTFSKTGLVEEIEIRDDGLYIYFAFHLVTGRIITIKKH